MVIGDSGDNSRGNGDTSEDCLMVMVRGRGTGGDCNNIFCEELYCSSMKLHIFEGNCGFYLCN